MAANVPVSLLLTVAEVAGRMRVSTKTVRRLIAAGKLPAVRVGHQVRVDSVELDAYVYGPGGAA